MGFDFERTGKFATFIGAILVTMGCHQPSRKPVEPARPRPWADVPLHRPSKSNRTNLPPLVNANNDLGLKLYDRMHHQDGSFVVSPACLTAGLALLETGANGETAREIARAMQRPNGVMRDDLAVAAFVQDLNADGPEQSFQIRLANALWVQEGYPLLDAYSASLRDVFAVENPAVDFAGRPADACRVINEWTETRRAEKSARC